MLKLSKKAEYAILAMQYMAANPGEKLTAKEIAASLDLSFEFLSKTMQSLMKYDLVISQQGVRGGYLLAKPAGDISLMEIINATDEKIGIVECMNGHDEDCDRTDHCTIKSPMMKIQKMISDIFDNNTLHDLIDAPLINKIHLNGDHKNLIEINNIISR